MTQTNTFHERLVRIEKGEQFIADAIIPKGFLEARRVKKKKLIRFGAILSVVLVFVTALIGVVMLRYGRYQIFGIDRADLTSLEGVILDGGGSIIMVTIILFVTKLDSMLLVAANVFGALASFLGMHMIVHRFPDLFAEIFSLQWLYLVLQSTEANQILQLSL